MQKKTIAMMLAAGSAIGMLTGCGVPEEEHLAALAAQEQAFDEAEDKLKQKIAEQETIIDNEKAKVREARINLDDNAERIKDLQQKSAETAKALATEKATVADLESQLKTAKSMASSAQEQADEWESKYNTLEVEYQDMKRRFEMFQKNLSAMGSSSMPAPAEGSDSSGLEELETMGGSAPAPKTEKDKAASLLDQMGEM